MKDKIKTEATSLRQKAEALLKLKPSTSTKQLSKADTLKLLHEYEVNQIELELQKEELLLANSKLHQSELQFKSLFENNHSVVLLIDPASGEIKDANTFACNYYGWSHSEICSKNISEINTLSTEEVKVEMQKSKDKKCKHFYYKHRMANGEVRDVKVYSGPVLIGNSNLLYSIIYDITDQKTAEENLQKSEEKYRNLVESINEVVYSITAEGIINYASSSVKKVFGYSPEEIIGNNILSFVHPDDKQTISKHLATLAKKDYFNLEYRYINKSGETGWVRASTIAIFEEGILIGGSGTIADITAQKKAEESLKKLSQAIEQSPVITYITNTNGLIEYVNPAGVEITGYSEEEILGQNPRIFSSGEKSKEEYKNLWQTIIAGNIWRGEFHNKKKNSEFYWVSASISPVTDDNGNILHYLAVEEDITQRKLAEVNIQQQNDRLNGIIAAMPDLIFVIDKKGTYTEVYAANLLLLPFPVDEIIGRTLTDFFDKERAADYLQYIHDCIQNQKLFSFEYNMTIENKLNYYEARITPYGKDKILSVVRNITVDKEKEAELKKLSLAVKQSPVSVVITDTKGNIEYANPAFELATGYSYEEIKGKNPRILKSGKMDDAIYRDLWETITAGKDWHGEWINKKKNGEFFWEDISISPVYGEAGEISNYLAVKQDITKRKEAENKIIELNETLEQKVLERTSQLKESHNRLHKIANRVPGVVYQYKLCPDGSSCFPYASGGIREIYRVTPEEVIEDATAVFKNLHPEDFDGVVESIQTSAKNMELWKHEYRVKFDDGTICWLAGNAMPQHEADGSTLWNGFITDITKRREVDATLVFEKQQLASILEGTNVGTWEWNIQTGETVYNERWAEILGYTLEEISPVSIEIWMNYSHPDDLKVSGELLEQHFKGELDYYSLESRMKHKNGNWVWVLDRGKVHLWDADGKPLLMSGTHQDITEQKHAREFENILLQLSLLINKTKNEDINSTINYALVKIGSFLYADRAYIFELSELSNTMSNTYEWCYEGISPEIENLQDLPLTIFPMWMKSLRSKENIQIDSVKDLPESWSAEREILEPQGIQSLLAIPILNNDNLMGFLGLDFVRSTKECNQSETNNLRVWANMLAGLLSKQRAEQILNQTRLNYETFFNTIDDFLFVLNEQGNIIHTNNRVINELEYSIEELLDQSVLMVHPPERREEAGRILGEMLAGTTSFCSVPLLSKTGHYIPVETRLNPGFWNGKPVIFGVSKDVTKMELSEQKFASAFQSNSAMMSISTFEEGKYIDVNKALCEILGYSRDEIIGSTNELLGIYIDSEIRQNIISRIKQDIQVHDEEVLMQTKTGEIKTCLVSTDSIYIGEERCTLSVTIDITARKIAEEELKKARQEAEKANLSKSEFLSRMSHELRTPMNSILGFAQIMEMSELNPSHKKRVNHILNNGNHLLKLINEVLDIAGIESGKLTFIIEPVQVIGIINEVLDVVLIAANKNNVTLELIDSPSNQFFVKADNLRLKQVLINLITNAMKYNKESGFVKISTELKSTEIPGSSKLRISIHDSGIGIKAENISKLFQPFERIGADESEIEGTGLGLSIVMKLTKAMGGTVGVESDLGVGSTFWIELPQNTNPPSVIRNKEVADKQNALPEDTVFSTVLYIDDNTSNIALVKEILAEYKPSVQLETSMYGKQALSLAKRHKPDLILLDLDLLDIKGSEVLEKLLADPNTKSIPVVVVSADAMSYQIENFKKAGATDYLTKPIDVIQFLKIINQYCKI